MNSLVVRLRRLLRLEHRPVETTPPEVKTEIRNEVAGLTRRVRALEITAQVQRGKR